MPGQVHASLKDFYPYRLSVLANLISSQIAATYQSYHLSVPMWRVMAVLAEAPDATATKIAEMTAMDKTAITRAVKAMSDLRYVKRQASQKDGRYSHLQLTRKGYAIYQKVMPLAVDYESDLLSVLSRQELNALDGVLEKLMQHCHDQATVGAMNERRR